MRINIGKAEISNCRNTDCCLGGFAAELHVLLLQQADQGAVVGLGIECDKLLAGAASCPR